MAVIFFTAVLCSSRHRELQEPFSADTARDTPEIQIFNRRRILQAAVLADTYRSLYTLLETLSAVCELHLKQLAP